MPGAGELVDPRRAAGEGIARQILDAQQVARGPAGRDDGLAAELDVRGLRRAEAVDVGVTLLPIVPHRDLLGDVARDRERDLAIALARRRRFELGHALLEVGAAITAKVGSAGHRSARCHQSEGQY